VIADTVLSVSVAKAGAIVANSDHASDLATIVESLPSFGMGYYQFILRHNSVEFLVLYVFIFYVENESSSNLGKRQNLEKSGISVEACLGKTNLLQNNSSLSSQIAKSHFQSSKINKVCWLSIICYDNVY
jgi:hypothetical protein